MISASDVSIPIVVWALGAVSALLMTTAVVAVVVAMMAVDRASDKALALESERSSRQGCDNELQHFKGRDAMVRELMNSRHEMGKVLGR